MKLCLELSYDPIVQNNFFLPFFLPCIADFLRSISSSAIGYLGI